MREKGLAQWRFEQAQLIIENAAAMSESDRQNCSTIFFRKKTDDVDADIIRNQFNVEAAITQLERKIGTLQESQQLMMETMQEIVANLPQQPNGPSEK